IISVSPGKHTVTATAKGYNITGVGWRGSWVQEDSVARHAPFCSARSVEAEFKGPPENVTPSGDYDEELTVSLVCDRGCKETEKQKENAAKEIALTAASEDCKDFNWEGSKISFNPPGQVGIPISMISEFPSFSLNKFGLAQSKTELRPGTYSLNFFAPHLSEDRKSTRLNSSHRCISYAVFCLKKKRHIARLSTNTRTQQRLWANTRTMTSTSK